jgi:hypothetical protein
MSPRGEPARKVVKELIARVASVNAIDAQGRTSLQRAVKACVDSYWIDRRAPIACASCSTVCPRAVNLCGGSRDGAHHRISRSKTIGNMNSRITEDASGIWPPALGGP